MTNLSSIHRSEPAHTPSGAVRLFVIAIVTMLVCLAALLVVGLQIPARLKDEGQRLDHASLVQSSLQDLRVGLLSLESSQRGYLLTQDPTYLKPYHASLERLDGQLAGLGALVAAQPSQAALFAQASTHIRSKRQELAESIVLADKRGAGAALSIVRSGRGQVEMEEIRTLLDLMGNAEAAAATEFRAERAADIERNIAVAGLLEAAIVLMMGGMVLLVIRERTASQRAVQVEQAAKQELEQRVLERTRELDAAMRAKSLSEARLQGIIESAGAGILTVDRHQVIVLANPAAAAIFGCPVEVLLGGALERFIPEASRASHRAAMQAFGEEQTQSRRMAPSRKVHAVRSDGSLFPIEASISFVELGEERLFTVIMSDVTERQKAEDELRASKGRLRAALDSMSDAVFIVDQRGALVDSNNAFTELHQLVNMTEPLENIFDYHPLLELCGADGAVLPLDLWPSERALRGEAADGVEYRIRRHDTGQGWISSVNFAPIRGEDGAIVGAVMTARDVTEIKRVQAELESSHSELRQLVAAQTSVQETERGRIARELHDDLQQWLAAIRINLAAGGDMLVHAPQEAPELLRKIDKLAADAIASTRRIVNDLRPQMLETLGLMPALEALTHQFTETTGIACRVEAQGSVTRRLADAPQATTCLFRVAQESLNNVGKHAGASGVRLIIQDGSDGRVVLRVSDNGRGIHPGQRRKPQSFGLLGIQERVSALDGHFRVDSRVGAGTTIEVSVRVDADLVQVEH